MTDRTDEFEFVVFWRRVLAVLLDVLVGLPFVPITLLLEPWALEHRTVVPSLLWSLVWIGAFMWFVVRFGGTPGKLLIGIRIVDVGGTFLTWHRAVRRFLYPDLIVNLVFTLQMWKAYNTYPDEAPRSTLLEQGVLLDTYGQPYSQFATIVGFAVFADIGVILFNRKKRAIHDFVAGSYVITKDSHKALGGSFDGRETPDPIDQPLGKGPFEIEN
jgi:uncharacterized RDD family membrane protein YckC